MPSKTVKFTPDKTPREKNRHGLGITIFSAVILVVIVVTFIGAPVVSQVSETPSITFGTYDGVPVDYLAGNYFSQQVENYKQFYEQFSPNASDSPEFRRIVWNQAFQQSALQVAFKREAEKAGIVVTDKRIDKVLVNHPSYLRDGVFSNEAYQETTAADKFRYRQETQNELLVGQYASDFTSGIRLSSSTASFVAGLTVPQRQVSYVTFTDADYPDQLVAEFGLANKALFRTINLSRITVLSSEAEAKKVREEAAKGVKTFAELAKTYSKDALSDTGGALNPRTYHELKNEIAKSEDLDKVFGLALGAISDVIVSGKTWTIYQVVAASVDADFSTPAGLALARSYMARNERGLLEDYLEAQAKAFQTAATADFSAAAKQLGKTVGKTGWVSLNFGNHDLMPSLSKATEDQVIQGLAANEDFFKKVFRTPVDGVTAPVLTGAQVLVFRIDAEKTVLTADDVAVTTESVLSRASSDRDQALQQSILDSPLFKNDFLVEFARQFPE